MDLSCRKGDVDDDDNGNGSETKTENENVSPSSANDNKNYTRKYYFIYDRRAVFICSSNFRINVHRWLLMRSRF